MGNRVDTKRRKSKKGGRPKKELGEKKEYLVSLKMNTSDYYNLKAKVRVSGCKSMSEYIRECLRNGYVKTRISLDEMTEVRKLTGIANNMNQLTRMAHQEGMFYIKSNLLRLMERIDLLIKWFRNDS